MKHLEACTLLIYMFKTKALFLLINNITVFISNRGRILLIDYKLLLLVVLCPLSNNRILYNGMVQFDTG